MTPGQPMNHLDCGWLRGPSFQPVGTGHAKSAIGRSASLSMGWNLERTMTTTVSQQNAHYREELLRLSDEIVQHVSAAEEQTCVPTGGQADGGLSNAPMHLGDLGTDASIQETAGVILENERYLFNEIDSALKRLDNGQFGRCESCGKPISAERLQAIPYARNCMQCAARADGDFEANLGSPQTDEDRFALDEKLVDTNDFGGEKGPLAFTNHIDDTDRDNEPDTHAAGTAGGGTAIGGLAGTNIGRGNPRGTDLERATGSAEFDAKEGTEIDKTTPRAGIAGGRMDNPNSTNQASKPPITNDNRTKRKPRKAK